MLDHWRKATKTDTNIGSNGGMVAPWRWKELQIFG